MFRRWHPDGTMAGEATLRAGQPEGLSHAWFPSGHLKAEVQLEARRVIRQQFWLGLSALGWVLFLRRARRAVP